MVFKYFLNWIEEDVRLSDRIGKGTPCYGKPQFNGLCKWKAIHYVERPARLDYL